MQEMPRHQNLAKKTSSLISKKDTKTSNQKKVIAVFGAGAAGSFSAKELGKQNKVILIEKGSNIIPNTSSTYNECYKIHIGPHYAGNARTAVGALEMAVFFIRHIEEDGGNVLAGGKNLNAKSRRGRFFFTSSSLFPAEDTSPVVNAIIKRYKELIKLDTKNKVLGEPEHLVKELKPSNYGVFKPSGIPYTDKNGQTKFMRITKGYETAESQIDIHKLREYLEGRILRNKNIQTLFNTTAINVSPSNDHLGWSITVKNNKNSFRTIKVDGIVNCTWSNIENIDKQAGLYVPDESRVMRIKVLAKIKLTDKLQKLLDTAIFAQGPFASFTNSGSGYAVVSTEVITNIGHYKAGQNPPEEYQKLIGKKLDHKTGIGRKLTTEIRKEASNYLRPEYANTFKDSEILEVMVGQVKMMHMKREYKSNSLFEKDSAIHARIHTGIETRDLCYISNSGNKMTYTPHNGAKVNKLFLEEHLPKSKKLDDILKKIVEPIVDEFLEKHNGKIKPPKSTLIYITCSRALIRQSGEKVEIITEEAAIRKIIEKIMKTYLLKLKIKIPIQKYSFFKREIKSNFNHSKPKSSSDYSCDCAIL